MAKALTVVPPMLFGFQLTATGLVVPPVVPSYEDWVHLGGFLRYMNHATAWLLGDWLTLGEAHYGEKMSQAMAATDLDSETLRKFAWVAERIAPERRSPALSFTHHQAVAALDPAAQATWLQRATTGSDGTPWSVRELKAAMQIAAPSAGHAPTPFWLVVGCMNAGDREACREECTAKGRQVKDL